MKQRTNKSNALSTTAMALITTVRRDLLSKTQVQARLSGLAALMFISLSLHSTLVRAETDTGGMNMGDMEGMDHSQMDMGDMSSDKKPDDMEGMDHGNMQMQGGDAPLDARDPHAYSGGQTLTTGDYAIPGPRTLVMADEYNMFSVLFNRLERVDLPGDNATVYDMMLRYGTSYNRIMFMSEGDFVGGKLEESSSDLMWTHAISAYWDSQLGVSYDSSMEGPNRSWVSAGVLGLSPYWFEVNAMVRIGEDSRTSFGIEAEYELLITQKLIIQPRFEAMVYGKEDLENDIGKGLSNMSLGLRLRYEIKREFAPYIGVEYISKYGDTADIARANNADVSDTRLVAGLRFWY